tara:strand:+ start:2556 stop:3767 length:1212 start_codon:yes stop_codon:yes gene_type:complete
MKIIVLKFGGTSVGSIQRISKVANIIKSYSKKYKVIVLASAMSGTTNKLINMSQKISKNFPDHEYDTLVSAGEQISCSLLSGQLLTKGLKSRSLMAWQIPILTEGKHKNSRIKYINKTKILKFLNSGTIPIIAGFQGVNKNFNITTIGRGGSDSSAIMFAKFFKAERCVIYTDVEGVYTTDPNKLNSANKIKNISYEEMLEMASLGSKVMQPHSIQDARLNRIDIEVKSSFVEKPGTLITKRKNIINNKIITGISSTDNDAKVTLLGVKDRPGIAASIFKPLSQNSINVDMVVQNISSDGNETDLTFTIKSYDLTKTKKIIKNNKNIIFKKMIFDKNVSKVSIIGVGMVTTPGVTFRMFQALANKNINIQVISTSEIKISVLIKRANVIKAIKSLHKEFNLEK